jgi:hypothetical protein
VKIMAANRNASQPLALPADLGHEWAPDFPVMTERIDYPAQAPAVRFLYGHDRSGPCRDCPREDRIWISYGQDHPNRAAA